MRRAVSMLLALVALACESPAQVSAEEEARQADVTPSQPPDPTPAVRVPIHEEAIAEGPPAIPGLLLATLEIEREGSFARPEGSDELELRAAVALGGGLALVGQAHARDRPDRPAQTWRWVGFASNADHGGEGASAKLDAGSIHAAISDGGGGALLVGDVADGHDARAWFGALNAKGAVTRRLELEGETSMETFELLAGHGPEERALLLGEVDGEGWMVSLASRGAVRSQQQVHGFDGAQLHALARLGGQRGDLLLVGTRGQPEGEAWWSTRAGQGGAGALLEQGKFEIEGADPDQTLDAIVDLQGTGFLALGRARRDPTPDHDQVIAVGFDPSGAPTWSRVLEHFRVTEIYGGAANPKLPGIANFVVRVPVAGGEGRSALGWLAICPGVDGILLPRQLGGTEGWASAGFVEGREDAAILTYSQTDAGIDWRVLPLDTSYRVGSPK